MESGHLFDRLLYQILGNTQAKYGSHIYLYQEYNYTMKFEIKTLDYNTLIRKNII